MKKNIKLVMLIIWVVALIISGIRLAIFYQMKYDGIIQGQELYEYIYDLPLDRTPVTQDVQIEKTVNAKYLDIGFYTYRSVHNGFNTLKIYRNEEEVFSSTFESNTLKDGGYKRFFVDTTFRVGDSVRIELTSEKTETNYIAVMYTNGHVMYKFLAKPSLISAFRDLPGRFAIVLVFVGILALLGLFYLVGRNILTEEEEEYTPDETDNTDTVL